MLARIPTAWQRGRTTDLTWRILVIAVGHMLTSLGAGLILGRAFDIGVSGISLLSGILIGITIDLAAVRIQATRLSHWIAWGSVLFFNALSVAIDGVFFAPTMSPIVSMPAAWAAYLLFQALVTAGLVAWLFGPRAAPGAELPRKRAWYLWLWRFVASSLSYLLFYFIFGAVNYGLVTKPYYAAHVSGLAVPQPQTVLLAEMVRAPMIVLSIVPLILLWRGRKSVLAVWCGIMLFVIGGAIPLLTNTALPDILRFASAVEVFFQNFLTGLVAAALLAFPEIGVEQQPKIDSLMSAIFDRQKTSSSLENLPTSIT